MMGIGKTLNQRLDEAVRIGDISLVKSLIHSIGILPTYERCIILMAIEYGHISIVKYCIDVLRVKPDTYLCLRIAAENNELEILKYLIEEVGLNIKGNDEIFAFATTNGWGAMDMLKYLVSKGVDINAEIVSDTNDTALSIAAGEQKDMRLVKYLVEEVGVNVDDAGILCQGVFSTPLEIVKYLLEKGAKIDAYILDGKLLGKTLSTATMNILEKY